MREIARRSSGRGNTITAPDKSDHRRARLRGILTACVSTTGVLVALFCWHFFTPAPSRIVFGETFFRYESVGPALNRRWVYTERGSRPEYSGHTITAVRVRSDVLSVRKILISRIPRTAMIYGSDQDGAYRCTVYRDQARSVVTSHIIRERHGYTWGLEYLEELEREPTRQEIKGLFERKVEMIDRLEWLLIDLQVKSP